MRIRRSISALLLLVASPCFLVAAQQTADAPEGWAAIVPPDEHLEHAQCANWAFDEWTVAAQGSRVRFSRPIGGKWTDLRGVPLFVAPQITAPQTAEVVDGRFMSVNRGEFGGTVSWQSKDTQRIQNIAETNLVAFVPSPIGLFGLIGLAHGWPGTGALVRFERGPDSLWRMRTVAALGAAPHSYTHADEDTLLVALSGALVSVDLNGGVRTLHRNPAWTRTYPNSIAIDMDARIYVGMRSAVARLTPSASGFVEDWLVTSDCVRRAPYPEPQVVCGCIS